MAPPQEGECPHQPRYPLVLQCPSSTVDACNRPPPNNGLFHKEKLVHTNHSPLTNCSKRCSPVHLAPSQNWSSKPEVLPSELCVAASLSSSSNLHARQLMRAATQTFNETTL